MNIKTISYRRIKNLGNYENESVEWVADLEEGDDPEEMTNRLRKGVIDFLYPPSYAHLTDDDDEF